MTPPALLRCSPPPSRRAIMQVKTPLKAGGRQLNGDVSVELIAFALLEGFRQIYETCQLLRYTTLSCCNPEQRFRMCCDLSPPPEFPRFVSSHSVLVVHASQRVPELQGASSWE